MKVTTRQISCRTKFEAKGYPRSSASALVGNFSQESGPSLPTAFRTKNLDHGSNGLAQWRLARLASYQAFVRQLHPELIEPGMSDIEIEQALWPWYGRMDHQVDFVCYELKESYSALEAKLRAGGSVSALTADICWQYERPNKAMSGIANRIAYATAVAAAPTPDVVLAQGTKAAVVQPDPGVADHMHAAIATHDKQAAGGASLAGLGLVGLAGGVVMNTWDKLPPWEWAVLGAFAIVVVIGVVGALVQRRNSATVQHALAGTDTLAAEAPPSKTAFTAPPAVAPSPKPDPISIPPDVLEAAVNAELNRRATATAGSQSQTGVTALGPKFPVAPAPVEPYLHKQGE